MEWVALIEAVLGILFGTALLAKLRSFGAFQTALHGYRFLPNRAVRPVAALTLIAELVSVVLLLGGAPRAGLIAGAALLSVFAGSVVLALRHGQPEDCGCLAGMLRIRPDVGSAMTNLALAGCSVAAATHPGVALLWQGRGLATSSRVTVWMAASLVVMLYWLAAYARTVLAITREGLTQEG